MDNNQEVYNTKQKINSWLSRYFFTNSLEQNTFWIRLLEQKGESYWCVFFLFFFFTHDNKENEERRKQTSFFIREEVLNNLQSGFCSKLCCWKHGCQITNVATTFDAEEVSEPKFCFVFSTFLTYANERYIGHSEMVCQEITGLFWTTAALLFGVSFFLCLSVLKRKKP